ncbi:MAG TPA: hypothetical protein VK843_19090 [Planctomycetota bacterium]|nr:hypothetical protein [Planctomycetota bacterium]
MLPLLTARLRALVGLPFFARGQSMSAWEAIGWWERRRLAFNLVVGAVGALTCFIGLVALAVLERFFHEPVEMPDPPIFIFFAIGGYAVMANVCFTGGWIVELLVRWLWRDDGTRFASIGFTLGLVFSAGLTLAPALFMVGVAGLQILFGAGAAPR